MPWVGFGTYKLKKESVKKPIKWALKQGYRSIDTAWIYDNEKAIGETISSLDIPVNDIFVTTKLWRSYQGYDRAQLNLQQSLKRLGMDYVDLWLLHYPGPGIHLFKRHQIPSDWTPSMRLDTWRAMEDAYQKKKVRAIGVSNFSIRHLEELRKIERVTPAVNQVELHPFLVQTELMEYCKSRGILVQAYGSLGEGDECLLTEKSICGISEKYGKSPAQVLLRWALQHGCGIIPKSGNKIHIRENSEIFDFELNDEEMKRLDGLNKNKRFCWKGVDPDNIQ